MSAEESERVQPANAGERSGEQKNERSNSPDAVRMRQKRAEKKQEGAFVGERGGGKPATKGNPMRPSDWSMMGEPLSPHEAERQLYWAHVGIAKALRSEADLSSMKEEFEVAGENYSFVANKMFPALRVMIRFVAPVVLVAVLFSIWVAIIGATPWWSRVGQWWANRGERGQQPAAEPVQTAPFEVVQQQSPPNGEAQASPPIPRRPAMVRRLR